jgi:hypothetical protein
VSVGFPPYAASIRARIFWSGMPISVILITSRVMAWHVPQVGAMSSKTTVPSAITART